jgi:hypothetical protein
MSSHHQFIKALDKLPPCVVHAFRNGGCFAFYEFVHAIFPEAEALYDGDHVIVRVHDRTFDAGGECYASSCHAEIESAPRLPELPPTMEPAREALSLLRELRHRGDLSANLKTRIENLLNPCLNPFGPRSCVRTPRPPVADAGAD